MFPRIVNFIALILVVVLTSTAAVLLGTAKDITGNYTDAESDTTCRSVDPHSPAVATDGGVTGVSNLAVAAALTTLIMSIGPWGRGDTHEKWRLLVIIARFVFIVSIIIPAAITAAEKKSGVDSLVAQPVSPQTPDAADACDSLLSKAKRHYAAAFILLWAALSCLALAFSTSCLIGDFILEARRDSLPEDRNTKVYFN